MRTNPFVEIYQKCNSRNNLEKYQQFNKNKNSYPAYIDIELTNHCNINCYMCPVGTRTMKRNRGMISLDVIDKLCDELKNSPIKGVRLIRWGEPALHKGFLDILRRLKNTGKIIHFNTNGTLMSREMLEEIVRLEIDSVKFSFQGVDRESYEEMRNGSSFQKVMDTIQLLNDIRKEKEKPYIQVSTTVTCESAEQIEEFKRQISGLCDYCNVGRTKMVHLDVDRMNISEDRKKKYVELREKESLVRVHFPSCPEVFDKLSINWDGSVTACCADYDEAMLIGNIKENSLFEIYHNERSEQIRELLSQERYDALPLCKTCFDYIEMQKPENNGSGMIKDNNYE